MKQFCYVTPNSFLTLPPVKQLYHFFKSKYSTQVVQSKLHTYEDFFAQEPSYYSINEYNTYDEYHKQTSWDKLKKLWKLFFFYLRRDGIIGKEKGGRIIYTHELFPLMLAILLKKKKEIIIYHQFEILPNKLNHIDRICHSMICKRFLKVNLAIFPEANRLELFRKDIQNYRPEQFMIIPNSNNNEIKLNAKKSKKEKLIITHIGGLGATYHIVNYLKAIRELDAAKYEFRFVGRLTDEVKKLIQSFELEHVKIIGQVKHNDLHEYYRETDIGVILYKDVSLNNRYCAPNKLYEYWSYGIPVIGDELPGLISVFTDDSLGELINMHDADNISKAINNFNLTEERKMNILNHFNKELKLEVFLKKMEQKIEF